jgi:hypothetical protein
MLIETEAHQIMLECGNTVEPPEGVGDALHELFLDGADGLVVVEESAGEILVGDEVLGGKDDGLAGQAVTVGVQGRALFAGCRLGAGGVGRVGAIARGAGGVAIGNWNGFV